MITETVPLGTHVRVIGGFAFPSESYSDEGIPVIRISDIQDGLVSAKKAAKIPEEMAGKGWNYQVEPGDILIAMSGATTGKIGVVADDFEGPFLQNQRVGNFRVADSNKVDKVYLRHYLTSPSYQKQLRNLMAGVAQPNISSKQLESIEIPLPPLPEQKRIAAILDKADSIRRKRQEAVRLTEELLRSVFLDMFGDPVIENTRWPISTLESACAKITDGTHHSPPIQATGVPYITAKHLKQYGLDFESDPWFISEEDHRQIFSRCNPRCGDVLYIKDGATTGLAAVNRYYYDFSMLSSLALLRPKADMLEAAYLCYWLNNPKVKLTMLGEMAGAAIRRLTLSKIKVVRIPIPPIELQRQFARRVLTVENMKKTQCKSQAEFDNLFNSSMQLVFKGDL